MKKIMTILLAILFILSITLNIIIFSSSYGTLLFKYDRTKFKSLINLNSSKLDISKFFLQKETGIQINYEYKDNETLMKYDYTIYFDDKSNLTIKIVESTQAGDNFKSKTSYFKDNYLYIEENESRTKITTSKELAVAGAINILATLNNQLSIHVANEENKAKTKIDVSTSPFYLLGFKYTVDNDISSSTYKFDLKGNLRKANIKTITGEEKIYKISYKKEKVTFPDLTQFK